MKRSEELQGLLPQVFPKEDKRPKKKMVHWIENGGLRIRDQWSSQILVGIPKRKTAFPQVIKNFF
jgi:hypothetical protein